MFVMNNCHRDARVLKEARSLTNAGYSVRIIAVLDKMTVPHQQREGFVIDRVVRDPIHYRILRSIRRWVKMPGRVGQRAVKTCTRGGARLKQRVIAIGSALLPLGLKRRLLSSRNTNHQTVRRSTETGPATSSFLIRPFRWMGRGMARSIQWVLQAMYFVVRRFLLLFHRPLCFLDYYMRAYALVRLAPSDFYHAHDFNTLPVAWWLRKKLGGALIYDSHELYAETSTLGWLERKALVVAERRLIRAVDVTITVNESIQQELVQRYRISSPVVIRNCPDMEAVSVPGTRIRDALHLSSQEFVILYQGGFAPNRGLETLLDAMRCIPEGSLVMMGWGRLEQPLRDQAEAMGLLDRRIFFIPPVTQAELLLWTSSADVGVIPYRAVGLNNYYSLPNKLFEYIAAGLPVAASQFPELKRIIETYHVGLTFDPEDTASMADAVTTLLGDAPLRETMRVNAREAARELNWGCEETKLLALYRELHRA